MQESLSNAEYYTPQQQEFDFEGYDSEPNSEDSFENAETLTLQAISSAPAFTDFFEDAKCLTRLYDNTSDDESKGFFYLFRAHDAEHCSKNHKSRILRRTFAAKRLS